jgi:hypothetical protein
MNNEQQLEEAEKLIWALLDERIDEVDTQRLETLFKENEQVRTRYLEISQIHADLYAHFGNSQPKPDSPALSFLGDFSTTPASSAPLVE